tara:strand:- start:1218 stop:1748 length:531 start_codon:yes stop_codon:yes gene_type:complete
MKWLILILLPLQVFAQEIYNNCGDILPQTYQVNYDINKEYFWDISSGIIVYNNNNEVTIQWPDSNGTYIILAYTTKFGCEGDTSYYEIIIEDCPYLQLYIPNSFTPNGDNWNETFYIQGASSEKVEQILIYNRWGEIVYETNNNTPWNGEDCQIGIYSYSVRTNNQHYSGIVHLIK